MNANMTMTYEYITPEKAEVLLETVENNRSISPGTVRAYANDILMGNWDETVGSAISIDENGVLRDGQHRLKAIVQSGVGIHTWVCRNVSNDGIYDNNRKRRTYDQVSILRPNFEKVYKQTRYISVAKQLITSRNRTVSPKEIVEFTEAHRSDLDGFFLKLPPVCIAKITISTVSLALFMAYMGGVKMIDILNFYDVLCTGMSTMPEEFPIIAYRNYLKDSDRVPPTVPEIARCQYALKKYLTGSCVKRTMAPKELIWPYPWTDEREKKGAAND